MTKITNRKISTIQEHLLQYAQKDEQKVIFTISFLIAAEGKNPKSSAGVPGADPVKTNSFCSGQQQREVREI